MNYTLHQHQYLRKIKENKRKAAKQLNHENKQQQQQKIIRSI